MNGFIVFSDMMAVGSTFSRPEKYLRTFAEVQVDISVIKQKKEKRKRLSDIAQVISAVKNINHRKIKCQWHP